MPGQNNDSDHQLISRFFEKELSAEEERTVDKRIQAEPAFAEKVAHFMALHRGARELQKEELEKLYPSGPPAGRRLPWWLWTGLALTLALALYLFFGKGQMPVPPPSGQPIALQTGLAAHEEARRQDPEYFATTMGGDWKADYRAGRYAKARQKLNAELDASDNLANKSRFCYYAGLLNLYPEDEPADLDRAITCLEIAQKEKEDAPLYLLIAYVQAGQLEKARALAAELSAEQMEGLPPKVRQAL
ncbi:MAG: hypothetical protein KDD01_09420 [Phaeodactylibacter sp.]|nr:hypothetical protein [Phaeodactylibacter sp.]